MPTRTSHDDRVAKSEGRIFAIGDIHGCANELRVLIAKLAVRPTDTVVFLGDYIDRGPDARGVVEAILELRKLCRVVTLKGNHEAMFLDFLERPESSGAGLFILNGGSNTLASYAIKDASGRSTAFEIPEAHVRFFYDLELCFETKTHFFVHAGVPLKSLKSLNLKDDESLLLWIRQPFLSSHFPWEKMIVHGHTPQDAVEVKPNRINLDTGCVFGGHLTALELPATVFHQVPRERYAEPVDFLRDPGFVRNAMRFSGTLPVEASLAGGPLLRFETLNYNQFGLLLREVRSTMDAVPCLKTNDVISGRIGPSGDNEILFSGQVVRSESRGDTNLYGVKVSQMSSDSEGREWISHPRG